VQERERRERNLFAKYITKQKINSKNSTMAGYQKRHWPINAATVNEGNNERSERLVFSVTRLSPS